MDSGKTKKKKVSLGLIVVEISRPDVLQEDAVRLGTLGRKSVPFRYLFKAMSVQRRRNEEKDGSTLLDRSVLDGSHRRLQ